MDGGESKGQAGGRKKKYRGKKNQVLSCSFPNSQDHCPPPPLSTRAENHHLPSGLVLQSCSSINYAFTHVLQGQSPNPLTRLQGALPAPSPRPGHHLSRHTWLPGSQLSGLLLRPPGIAASLLPLLEAHTPLGDPCPAPSWTHPWSSRLHPPGHCTPANTGTCVQWRWRYLWVFFVQLKFSETDVVPTLFTIFNIWHSTGLDKCFSWGKQDKSVSETNTKGGLHQ